MRHGVKHDEAEIIREAVMDSLAPNGVIAKRFLHKDWQDEIKRTHHLERRLCEVKNETEKKSILINIIRKKLSFALLPLTQSYLEEGKTVWDNYWSKALELYFQIKDSIEK